MEVDKEHMNIDGIAFPYSWKESTIGEVAMIQGGGTPNSFIKKYWNGNIDWFTPTEIGETKYVNHSIRRITEEGLKDSSAKLLPINTILLTTRAGIGDASILKKEACTNQGFQSLIARECINHEYLYYFILTLQKVLEQNASGSTFLEISPKNLSKIKIPLPPLPEQQAIAEVLSDTDNLIQALEKQIAKKRLIKQGAMQKLLTPKEGWEEKRLGDVGEIVTGSTPPTSADKYWNGNIPWITPTDICKDKNIELSEREITEEGQKISRRLPANTLLVTCIASIGKNAILRKDGACNQQINAIIPNKNYNVDFLYYLIEYRKNYLLANAGITATLIISKKDFSELIFSMPPSDIQIEISVILSDIDNEIEILNEKLSKYKQLKQGLMQNLLTGKIRLV